ncbi:MAG: MauE/DoxX family redox-associated membrane protein [Lutibacter sp.]
MKFNTQTRNNIVSIICYIYVLLFTYAATSKLLDFENFRLQLGRFPFISTYAIWIAWGVPFLEIVIAGLFLFSKFILTALYASFSLMSIFTAYIILVLKFSDSVPCSCGGVISALDWKEHLIFNYAFIAIAIIGILLIEKNKKHVTIKNTT